MSYTKNHDPWVSTDPLTTTDMNNFETIYTEASSHLSTHTHDSLYHTRATMLSTYWNSTNDGSGSGADADLIYRSTGNMHAAGFAGLGIPTGLIILWYGSVATIPSGWQLCNGTGTPDMRGRFPIGSGTGATYAPGASGGSETFTAAGSLSVSAHTLSISEMASHNHPFLDANSDVNSAANLGSTMCSFLSTASGTTPSEGGGGPHGHSSGEGTSFAGDAVACLPFSIALCYIQKT